jgi:AmiR/NasT family two-component response regulator
MDDVDDHGAVAGLRVVGPRQPVEQTYAELAARIAHLEAQVDTLQQALKTNRRIGAAIGVLMAVRKVTYDNAFLLLKSASQTSNVKLRDVAEDVLLTGTLDSRYSDRAST